MGMSGSFKPPPLYFREKPLAPVGQEAGWAQEPVWMW